MKAENESSPSLPPTAPAAEIKRLRDQLKVAFEETKEKEERIMVAMNRIRQLQEELKKTQERLAEVEKIDTIGRLAAGVAHEVKNPLAIVLQGIDFLLASEGSKPAETRTVIRDMEEAVHRADSIVSSLMDFSAVLEVKMELVDLNQVIGETLDLLKHQFDRAQIHVMTRLDPRLPWTKFDKNRIQQVFVNLILNSVHAMSASGGLQISTFTKVYGELNLQYSKRMGDIFSKDERVIVAEVRDTGCGISEEVKRHLFEPFFTTRRGGGGTGLGLAVVRNILDMHRAGIEIRNNEDAGARATVVLKIIGGD